MSIININGNELELDLLDADVMEKFERLNSEIVEKMQNKSLNQNASMSGGMKLLCGYVDNFFDKLFSAGTAQKLFGGNHNLGIRLDAYGRVCSESKNILSEVHAITDKYGAARIQNREQKRHGGKQKYRNRDRRRQH